MSVFGVPGMYAQSWFSLMNIDDLVHFTLREWTRMSLSPTTAEVERAKSQTKAALLLGLDGTSLIADDVSEPSSISRDSC